MPPNSRFDHRPPNGGRSRRRSPSPVAESIDSMSSYDQPWRDLPQSRPHRPSPVSFGSTSAVAGGSVIMNKTFQKLLALLLVIVIVDVFYLWDFFHGIDANTDGSEAGIHRLHESHKNRRVVSLMQQIQSGLHMNIGGSTRAGSEENFDSLTDEEKVIELENEIYEWKDKYEKAMHRLHENPYPDGPPNLPFTPVPPIGEDQYVFKKAKKSRAELAKMDTFGVHEKMVKILHAAQVEIDKDLAEQLPTWDQVVSLYGDKPIIHGLETCETYRKSVRAEDRMTGPAGMFNTGTNLLYELLKTNCDIKEARRKFREPKRNGMRWQVPWGKHNPPTTHRFRNVAKAWGKGIRQGDFFPVVLIKDPYSWMGSQCRHKYATYWGHDDEHCPNLVRWKIPEAIVPSEVRVKFALQMKAYDSLLDVWNKWYEEWEAQPFPHITTRFEDLLFHGEEVSRVACECVGGVFAKEFQYVEDSAKKAVGVHTGANGLVKAMLHYGDPAKRLNGFTDRDRIYAKDHVDYNLMKRYSYTVPPMPGEVDPPAAEKNENNEEEKHGKTGAEEDEKGDEEAEERDEENRRDDEEMNEDNGNEEETDEKNLDKEEEEEKEDTGFKDKMEERDEEEMEEDNGFKEEDENSDEEEEEEEKDAGFGDKKENERRILGFADEEEEERRNAGFGDEEEDERRDMGFGDEEEEERDAGFGNEAEEENKGFDIDAEEEEKEGFGDEEEGDLEEERNERFDVEAEEDKKDVKRERRFVPYNPQ